MITSKHTVTTIQQSIIQTVLYFDIFQYPLTIDELFENSAIIVSREEFDAGLEELFSLGILLTSAGFILSSQSDEAIITKRLLGNANAQSVMPLAHRYSKKVASFPFVEGICLSGSLSKNYYDDNSDIDFFIITKPGRLWICRTLLILKYKFLPKHKKKYWCINYLISSDSLAIPDKNVFASTELAYLIPTVNYHNYISILQNNDWYKTRFPNKKIVSDTNCMDTPEPLIKRSIEAILSGRLGKWADDALLRMTLKHWRKKYPEMGTEDFELQFRSRKGVCKRHTKGFQNIVLTRWKQKQDEYVKLHNISFKECLENSIQH